MSTTTITIKDLTIRQAKKLGRELEVRGFSKLNTDDLIEAIKMKEPDAVKLQAMIDRLIAPEAGIDRASKVKDAEELVASGKYGDPKAMSKGELEDARLEALQDIAKAAGRRARAEEKLRSVREVLNQEVSEAKANLKGAMERTVDYNKPDEVKEKLEALAEAWQGHEDSLEKRRLELEPLKAALAKARSSERKVFEDTAQLKLKF